MKDTQPEKMYKNKENKTYTEFHQPATVPLLKIKNTEKIEHELGEFKDAQEVVKNTMSVEERTLAFEVKFYDQNTFQEYLYKVMTAFQQNGEEQQSESFEFSLTKSNTDTAPYILSGFKAQNNHTEAPPKCSAWHEKTVGLRNSPSREEFPVLNITNIFTIDATGSKELNESVPSYKRTIGDDRNEEAIECKRKKEEKEEAFPKKRQTGECFNCGATNHSLRECPKPHNKRRISRNRTVQKFKRYYSGIQLKFDKCKPGEICDETRIALGLKTGELPSFFYGMRKLGYPPAWLEEAKIKNWGISLLDSKGQAVNDTENLAIEEGKYDVSKIISFPGFNVDPGPDFSDDYKKHNVPAISHCQMKDEFIKVLGDKAVNGCNHYKRKKLENLPSTITSEYGRNRQNMEDINIHEFDLNSEAKNFASSAQLPPTRSDEDLIIPPPPPPPIGINWSTTEDGSKRKSSPFSSFIKESHFGTPIFQFSRFDKLPDIDNFKAGISESLNFESLSSSTGIYEKIKSAIKKVRWLGTQLRKEE